VLTSARCPLCLKQDRAYAETQPTRIFAEIDEEEEEEEFGAAPGAAR
jgi:hypothetical protein